MALLEQQLPTGTWEIDPTHSSAAFSVRHSGIARFRGSFGEIRAWLADGVLTGVVPVASVEVKDQNLYGHLQSPDFFDAELNPEIVFVSTGIRPDGERVTVEGDLTVRGVTRRVEAQGEIAGPTEGLGGGRQVLGIELTTKIDRTEFGLNWNAPLPSGALALANDVTLTVQLELAQPEA